MPQLLSVNVGLPRDVAWEGRTVRTAIWKTAVAEPCMARRLNVDGDGQGDLAGHGGENRAVFVYQIAAYRYWAAELHRDDFTMGQFGENFTVDGLGDDEVCIGDRYRIGAALFEVTQPRVTCYRVGMRMSNPQMPALLVARGKPGFYFRVLTEGVVRSGDAIEKVAAGPQGMTVAQINALLYLPGHDRAGLERALRIPALSAGWRESFTALRERGDGDAGNAGLAPADAAPAAWPGFRPVRITALTREAIQVTSVALEAADGAPLAAPLPGQYVIVRLRRGPDAAPVMRSFSLCGLPSATSYRLGVKCEAHAIVGTYLAEQAKVGDELDVSAPRGQFVLNAGTGPIVFVSAGIGVTPVLAMLQTLAAQASPRALWWLYGARSAAEHPFAAETRALLRALPHARRHIRYSRPGPSDVADEDVHSVGRLDVALFSQLDLPHDAEFYLCGPAGFLREMRAGLERFGVAAEHIHAETFGSGPSLAPGVTPGVQRAPHPPVGTPGPGPRVSFARSNVDAPWNPAARTLLEFAEACDVPVRWSCRTGVCHTCETGVVAGSVSYEPRPLELPATGTILLCCARPESDLILDL